MHLELNSIASILPPQVIGRIAPESTRFRSFGPAGQKYTTVADRRAKRKNQRQAKKINRRAA